MHFLDGIANWLKERLLGVGWTGKETPTNEVINDLATARINELVIADMARTLREKQGLTGHIASILGIFSVFNGMISGAIQIALERYFRRVRAAYQPYLPSAEQIYDLQARGIISDGVASEWLKQQGYNQHVQDLVRQLFVRYLSQSEIAIAYRFGLLTKEQAIERLMKLGYQQSDAEISLDTSVSLLSPIETVEAWRKGVIQDVDAALREQGFRDQDIEAFKQITLFFPSPSDLLRLALKDVFEPNIVSGFRLDEDFDEAWPNMKPWAEAIGLREDVARLYWRAQWELPSLNQGFEMFQRGIISRDELNLLFKTHDILPFFRDKLLQLAYNPFTRVDVRRMFDLGVLSYDQMIKAYQDIGYSPENARHLADFTVKLVERSQEFRQGKQRDLTTEMVLKLYSESVITRDTAKSMLIQLRYDDQEAELLLTHMDVNKHLVVVREAHQAIETLYTNGTMDEQTARSELLNVGYQPEIIDEIIRIWNFRRDAKLRAQEARDNRDLTKAELLEAYQAKMISRDVLKSNLQAIGYDETEAETLARIADYRLAKAERQRHITALRTQFVHQKIPDNQIIMKLDALGISASERDALIAQWMIEREEFRARKEAQQQRLTKDEIRQLITKKIVSKDDGRTLLRREGYGDAEIDLLYRLWGLQ